MVTGQSSNTFGGDLLSLQPPLGVSRIGWVGGWKAPYHEGFRARFKPMNRGILYILRIKLERV
jgi:hypothetical protein